MESHEARRVLLRTLGDLPDELRVLALEELSDLDRPGGPGSIGSLDREGPVRCRIDGIVDRSRCAVELDVGDAADEIYPGMGATPNSEHVVWLALQRVAARGQDRRSRDQARSSSTFAPHQFHFLPSGA